jgi:hypothetical protein
MGQREWDREKERERERERECVCVCVVAVRCRYTISYVYLCRPPTAVNAIQHLINELFLLRPSCLVSLSPRYATAGLTPHLVNKLTGLPYEGVGTVIPSNAHLNASAYVII